MYFRPGMVSQKNMLPVEFFKIKHSGGEIEEPIDQCPATESKIRFIRVSCLKSLV